MKPGRLSKWWLVGNTGLAGLVFALSLFGFVRDLAAVFPAPEAVDLIGPYTAAVILNGDQPQALYDYSRQQDVAKRQGLFTGGGPYNYLPFLAVMLRPLVVLRFQVIAYLWLLLSLLALFLTTVLLLNLAKLRCRALTLLMAFAICLLFAPVTSNLVFGQVNTMLFLLVTATVYLVDSYPAQPRSQLLAGMFTGLATALKIYPALLLLPITSRKRWQAVAGFAVSLGLALLVGIIGAGGTYNTLHYLVQVLPHIGSPALPTNQSLGAAIQRLLVSSEYRFSAISPDNYIVVRATPLVDAPGLVLPLAIVLSFSVLVGAGWTLARIYSRRLPPAWDLSLLLTAALIVLPLVWDYYHALLLVPWATWLRTRSQGYPTMTVILLATFLVTMQRYWKPMASFHVPIWLFSFGLGAVIVTFLYTIYLVGTKRANRI